jgi:riboflavin kinase/FMN adenylyltransferase
LYQPLVQDSLADVNRLSQPLVYKRHLFDMDIKVKKPIETRTANFSCLAPKTGGMPRVEHVPMPVFQDHRDVSGKWHGGVYAIGNFDGLHIGHQALIQETIRIAAETTSPPAIMTFDPHPRELFDPSAPSFRLATSVQKTQDLARLGMGLCLNQYFDMNFAALTPEAFAEQILMESLRATHVVVGADFRFGSRQSGNTEILTQLCADLGIGLTVIDQIRVAGKVASSSLIRDLIASGEMSAVANVLGRPWSVVARAKVSEAGLSFDLSDYTRIRSGEYAVRVYGIACRATLSESGEGRQILSVSNEQGLITADHARVDFISSDV